MPGTPLVLLPGLLTDAGLWEHQIRHLSDLAEVRVADLTGADGVAVLAARVLAGAPGRFALAGLSMGGYVAMEILRQAPERVERLALLDTSARPDTAEQTERRQALIATAEEGRFAAVMPRLLPMLIPASRQEDRSLTAALVAMAERMGPEAFVRQQRAIMGRPDSRPSLGRIRCPTLVLVGREDALTPPERAEEMAEAIPGAKLAIVEECGHMSTMERPQAVTALMRMWLRYG